MHWFGKNDRSTLEEVVTYLREAEKRERFNAETVTTQRDKGQRLAAANVLRAHADYIEDAVQHGPTPEAVLERSAKRLARAAQEAADGATG